MEKLSVLDEDEQIHLPILRMVKKLNPVGPVVFENNRQTRVAQGIAVHDHRFEFGLRFTQ